MDLGVVALLSPVSVRIWLYISHFFFLVCVCCFFRHALYTYCLPSVSFPSCRYSQPVKAAKWSLSPSPMGEWPQWGPVVLSQKLNTTLNCVQHQGIGMAGLLLTVISEDCLTTLIGKKMGYSLADFYCNTSFFYDILYAYFKIQIALCKACWWHRWKSFMLLQYGKSQTLLPVKMTKAKVLVSANAEDCGGLISVKAEPLCNGLPEPQ